MTDYDMFWIHCVGPRVSHHKNFPGISDIIMMSLMYIDISGKDIPFGGERSDYFWFLIYWKYTKSFRENPFWECACCTNRDGGSRATTVTGVDLGTGNALSWVVEPIVTGKVIAEVTWTVEQATWTNEVTVISDKWPVLEEKLFLLITEN